MRARPTTISPSWSVLLLTLIGGVWLAYLIGKNIVMYPLMVLLFLLPILAALVLLYPGLGLYVFPFAFLLVPYDWRIPGLKFTSAPTVVVVAATMSALLPVVRHRVKPHLAKTFWFAGAALLIAWGNFVRYGSVYLNLPYSMTQALLLSIIIHLTIRSTIQFRRLLLALMAAITLRYGRDILVILYTGNIYAIRSGEGLFGIAVTSQAEIISMLLPLLMVLSMTETERWIRTLARICLATAVVWTGLSTARVGVVGLVLAVACLTPFLYRKDRSRLLILSIIEAFLFFVSVTILTRSWDIVGVSLGAQGPTFGRGGMWLDAWQAFLRNPWVGSGLGVHHSYWLGVARAMGLLYLIPFWLAMWSIWRRSQWLKRQALEPTARAFLVGFRASFLANIALSFGGTTLQAAHYPFVFWMLVGMLESLCLQVQQSPSGLALKSPTTRLKTH